MNPTANPLKWGVDWNDLPPLQRFFMWMPLVGPQMRIYRDLIGQLEARPENVDAWGEQGPEVRDAASRITRILKDHLGWPESAAFLPQDPADILFWDRTGDLAATEAIMAIEKDFEVEMREDFWHSLPRLTFAEAITMLLRAAKAEQAGTGQPATRPVVEPEGSYKPQSEAEGRSR
jgi:hypothetical protein